MQVVGQNVIRVTGCEVGRPLMAALMFIYLLTQIGSSMSSGMKFSFVDLYNKTIQYNAV